LALASSVSTAQVFVPPVRTPPTPLPPISNPSAPSLAVPTPSLNLDQRPIQTPTIVVPPARPQTTERLCSNPKEECDDSRLECRFHPQCPQQCKRWTCD
jgi:hypothetical protein